MTYITRANDENEDFYMADTFLRQVENIAYNAINGQNGEDGAIYNPITLKSISEDSLMSSNKTTDFVCKSYFDPLEVEIEKLKNTIEKLQKEFQDFINLPNRKPVIREKLRTLNVDRYKN